MTDVIRSADCANSPKNARAEEIALALMGIGALPDTMLAENAVWDGAGGALAGRAAILDACAAQPEADKIRVEQVVTHGAAGSVSGRITRGGETRLYCHVIRFSSAAAKQIAHLVSFEHPGGKSHVG
jgi:hypothetical protein